MPDQPEVPPSFWPGIVQFQGPHWEECSLDAIVSTPGSFPDWKFSIVTYDKQGDGRLPVCEFHLHLRLDQQAQNFVHSHPWWRSGMQPLILWVVRELLLRVKIVDAETGVEERIRCGISDPKRGTFEGYFYTRKHVAQEGITWIHVVNYANTHIRDSLATLYDKHPELAPTEEDIERTRRFFYEGRAQEAIAQSERQKVERAKRRHGTASLSIFMDESGDTGFRNSDFYVSTAVFLPTEEAVKIRSAMAHVIDLCWFRQKTRPTELHFSQMPELKQQRVGRLLGMIIRRLNCRVLTYVALKPYFLRRLSRSEAEFRRAEDEPIRINWGELLAENRTAAAKWLLAYLLDETISHIVIENLEEINEVKVSHDRKLYDWQNQAVEEGAEVARQTLKSYVREVYGEDTTPEVSFGYQPSETEPCLWLADWIGWEMQRFLKTGQLSPELAWILPKATCVIIDHNGLKVSVDLQTNKRLHVFPDLPRDISTPSATHTPMGA